MEPFNKGTNEKTPCGSYRETFQDVQIRHDWSKYVFSIWGPRKSSIYQSRKLTISGHRDICQIFIIPQIFLSFWLGSPYLITVRCASLSKNHSLVVTRLNTAPLLEIFVMMCMWYMRDSNVCKTISGTSISALGWKYFSLSYFSTICCEYWQILPIRTNTVFKWCMTQCLVYCRVYVHKMVCTKMAFFVQSRASVFTQNYVSISFTTSAASKNSLFWEQVQWQEHTNYENNFS